MISIRSHLTGPCDTGSDERIHKLIYFGRRVLWMQNCYVGRGGRIFMPVNAKILYVKCTSLCEGAPSKPSLWLTDVLLHWTRFLVLSINTFSDFSVVPS